MPVVGTSLSDSEEGNAKTMKSYAEAAVGFQNLPSPTGILDRQNSCLNIWYPRIIGYGSQCSVEGALNFPHRKVLGFQGYRAGLGSHLPVTSVNAGNLMCAWTGRLCI